MATNNDDDSNQLVPLDVPPTWFSPWNYPTSCSNDLAIGIASAIARGASFNASVMSAGVSPNRARQWLAWGDEAYQRDANAEDRDAQYLNFFLKIMQAVGYSSTAVQQQMRLEHPSWWLAHNPEQRGEWGNGMMMTTAQPLSPLAPQTDPNVEHVVEANQPTQLPTPSAESMKSILKTLVRGGAVELPDDASDQRTG